MATAKTPKLQEKISTVILAAGVGKRMRSETPKILHRILGKPVISFVLDLARDIGSNQIVLVVNRQTKDLRELGKNICCAIQEKPLGSGDAAIKGLEKSAHDNVLILCGDVPLIQTQTILDMIDHHERMKASLTVLTCKMSDPYGYGRIIRRRDGFMARIVEQSDATTRQSKTKEINAGVYYGNRDLLLSALRCTTDNNKQGEYYLTQAVHGIAGAGKKVAPYMIKNEEEIIGVNTKVQLARVRSIVKRRWFEHLMQRGVLIEDPSTTDIDLSVRIGERVHIRPHTMIEGNTTIRDGESVGPFVWINNGRRVSGANA